MNIEEIVKDSVRYPFSDWKKFLLLGFFILIISIFSQLLLILPFGVIIGYLIGLFVIGYLYGIIKSSNDEFPKFKVDEIFIDGLKVLVVSIVYIIPAILITLLFGMLYNPSSVNGLLTSALNGNSIGAIIMPLVSVAGPWMLLTVLLYIIIIMPILFIAIATMANKNSEINAAFKFREILDTISIKGWKNLFGWYLISGLIALIIYQLGILFATIFSKIVPIIGTILLSLVVLPYIYIYLSRSIKIFYVNTNLRITRRYIGLILILIVGSLVLSVSTETINHNNQIKHYNSTTSIYSSNGISFNFPSNWTINTVNDGEGTYIIISPDTSNPNAPLFEISVLPNPYDMSDQDSINSIELVSDNQPGWTKISNNTLSVDGNTAYEYTFSVNDSTNFNNILTIEQINIVKNGTTYAMIIQAPANDFNNEKPYFDTILNSFKIK